ncbi:MAG TPA: iron uptake porin, partial [Candidatus Caenarcaniphilales bacterium]
YRGNRALTRYEFAAGLYACLNSLAERLQPEDLAAIRRLQDEFAAELATLRGRVDALEARTTELEANQFSTTTKLAGEVVIAPQYGEGGALADPQATLITRARLNFNTSFSGDDLLVTQLEFGNEGEDIIGANFPGAATVGGSSFSQFVDPGATDYSIVGGTSTPILRRLAYTFTLGDDFAVTVGPRLFPSDFVDVNSYANNSAQDFSSGFFINNPLIINNVFDTFGGAGAAIDWKLGGSPFSIRATYVAVSANQVDAGSPVGGAATAIAPATLVTNRGLLGDPYQGTVELAFEPGDAFAVRLQYTSASVLEVKSDVLGVNAEVSLGPIGIFGRYGNGVLNGYGAQEGIDLAPETWMGGVGIKDVFTPGSLLAVAVGQPFVGGEGAIPGTDATQTNYEAFYKFAVSDNISVTPTFMMITDANNSSASDTIYQGVLRTTFSF